MNRLPWLLSLLTFLLPGCIGDDFVMDTIDPTLRITSLVETLGQDDAFQFTALYLNNIGQQEAVEMTWESSDSTVIAITPTGLATALDSGAATIRVSYNDAGLLLQDSLLVQVGEETVVTSLARMGNIRTTSSYALEGDFTLTEDGPNLKLEFASNYRASTALPGLYVYLTNNPATTSNALEIGAVEVFNGAHSYTIPGASLNDYGYLLYFCKPFNVKVGDGEIQ